MNRNSSFGFPLSSKLLITLSVVSLLPFIALLVLVVSGITTLMTNNVSAYLIEATTRREQSMRLSFSDALNEYQAFISDSTNSVAINRVLEVFNFTDSPTSRAQVETTFTNRTQLELLGNETQFFNSVWLISAQGELIASSSASNRSLPFNRSITDQRETDIYRALRAAALRDTVNPNLERVIVATERDGRPSVEVGYVLANSGSVAGYLVTDLNLQKVIEDFLRPQDTLLDAYSFVILPNNVPISLANIDRLVTLDSSGARAALGEARPAVSQYITNTNPTREVVGYFSRLEVAPDFSLRIITEIGTEVIGRQVTNLLGNIAFPFLLGILALLGISTGLLNQVIVPPLLQLREAARAISQGRYDTPLPSTQRGDEISGLSISFADMRQQVNQVIESITAQLDERQRDLRITQDISRIATEQRNLQTLLNTVVNLIVQNFEAIYHAQIFLVDTEEEYAILRASTGEAGQRLLARGHRLAVGSVSVIGQVTEQGQIVVARDTSLSNVHRQNEFLTETRSELAIPLKLGAKVIGALDMQSKLRDSFTPDQVAALQSLADQLTIAIENARLYEESQRLLNDMEAERRARTGKAWGEYLRTQQQNDVTLQAGNATETDFNPLRRAAFAEGRVVVGQMTAQKTIPFAVPIRLRGQVLGVVEYEISERDFSYNKVLLAEELVNRLAISLDNARLFQDSQRAAERERLVNDISAKLTGQTDIEEILQIAVREVSVALRTPQVALRLYGGTNGNGTHASDAAPLTKQSDQG